MAQSKPIQMKFPYGRAYFNTPSILPPSTILLSGWIETENTPPGFRGEDLYYLTINTIIVVLDFLKQFPVRKVHFTHEPDETYGRASFEQLSPNKFGVILNLDYIRKGRRLESDLEDFIYPRERGDTRMNLLEFEKGKRFACTF